MKRIFISPKGQTNLFQALLNVLLLSIIAIVILWFSLAQIGVTFNFSFLGEFKGRLWSGFLMTIYLSLASLVLSLIFGLLGALMQESKIIILRYLAQSYVFFIRGTPLIMQIYLFFYIIGTAFGIENRFICGVLILSIFEGAYICEIIRGSLLSQDNTQLEVAKAVGFTQKQTMRYVVFPQLLARTLPALAGQFASIIKGSSLLSMIAVVELMQTIREISSTNFKLFECYLFLGILYFVLTLPITFMTQYLEKKFFYEN